MFPPFNYLMHKLNEKQIEAGAIKVSSVCSYIDANLNSQLSLKQLVEVSEVSYQDLIELFKAHKNTTPMQYIRAKRTKLTHTNP